MAKKYLIIGGSHGIGLELTRRLLADGHLVTVVSRTVGELDLQVDGLQHFVADIKDGLPDGIVPDVLDGLVYCPGSINLGPIRGVDTGALVDEFRLNVIGAVECIQASLRSLKKSDDGSVVMFSTVAVGQGMPMHSTVASVKGAIEGLTRSLAAELAPNIRVNAIAPALVDTPLAGRLLSSDEKKSVMGKRHPMGRVGTASDIAAMAHFLLAGESSWITGQILGVDGGLSQLKV